jgi:formate/nitrite transporter
MASLNSREGNDMGALSESSEFVNPYEIRADRLLASNSLFCYGVPESSIPERAARICMFRIQTICLPPISLLANIAQHRTGGFLMDYVPPDELLATALGAAVKKGNLSVRDMLIRGFLAGVILSYATSLAFVVTTQGLVPIVGAILFPVGFVILVLLGLELATGNFALLPAGLVAGKVSFAKLARNWFWVYAGNLGGSLFYALLFYLAITNFNTGPSGTVGDLFKAAAQKKTLGYMALGFRGWEAALVKGILCNWMVTLGAVLALASRSTIGKIAAMWLPILTFFAQGYEHSIVNMFVIPAGKFFGAPVSLSQWWLWNQIPVTLGNMVSGVFFTGLALYFTYKPKVTQTVILPVPVQPEVAPAYEQGTAAG